jgi:hypothetical protein
MTNIVDVAGFQFTVDGVTITGTSGGSAYDPANGMQVSSAGGTVIGFSLTGSTIPSGDGLLLVIEHSGLGDGDEICLGNPVFSDPSGSALSVNVGECSGTTGPPEGCMDETACNYDPLAEVDNGSCAFEYDCADVCGGDAVVDECGDCNGSGPAEGFDCEGNCIVETDCAGVCGGDAVEDCAGECGGDAEVDVCGTCDGGETDLFNCLSHFADLPAGTGVTSLVIIQDALDLQPGDEIGLFDANAITNYGDCSSEMGNLLVGAGVWTGSQLNLTGVGSVDLCPFGGQQFAGYVDGNPIVIKVWVRDEDREYDASATYAAGTGSWGEIITSISLLEPIFSITQEVGMDALMMNMISFGVHPENGEISSVLADNSVLISSNDAGQYYAPGFGVDLIGEMDMTRGYKVFLNGMDNQTVALEGLPMVPAEENVHVSALQMNLIGYTPQDCMPTDYIFEGHTDQILIVKDDSGAYYVPSYGVMTLTEMCSGSGYEIFLSGMDDMDFTYPSMEGLAKLDDSELAIEWKDYPQNSASEQYELTRTGISHPIIITELSGIADVDDELVAYANGQVVGAAKIVDTEGSVVLTAWGGYNSYDVELPGYEDGDAIELRLYSSADNRELRVVADLDNAEYGTAPVTVGTAVVFAQDAVPTEFGLSQNYPNPFNPSTTIEFSVASSGHVSLMVYDITGRVVANLVDGEVETGYHSILWNGLDQTDSQVSAGIYIYALQTETGSITKKMVFMK